MISGILLTAGCSSRFGSPKALAKWNNKLIFVHLQETLISSKVDEIIVVLGAFSDEIKPYLLNHKKVKFVYNKDYNFGQTSSFQAGLKFLSDRTSGVLLLPVDYPFVQAETIDALIDQFLKARPKVLIPTFDNHKGHPPIFDVSLKEKFLTMAHDAGINTIAHKYKDETVLTPVDDKGVVLTFNTVEEFKEVIDSL
ncbi:MAG: nucleotidyltransferase family protein [Candidatus Omnitrophica bacterium]|nr:nucleotidyltransferase family protein [Candidatus Omnitrophota bacterium]